LKGLAAKKKGNGVRFPMTRQRKKKGGVRRRVRRKTKGALAEERKIGRVLIARKKGE